MATLTEVIGVLKARAIAAALPYPVKWMDEDNKFPDIPATFAFASLVIIDSRFVAFGGGRGANTQRYFGYLDALLFLPRGTGMEASAAAAEQFSAAFRSYRDDKVSCFESITETGADGSQLAPPGMSSPVQGYQWGRSLTRLEFDQIG